MTFSRGASRPCAYLIGVAMAILLLSPASGLAQSRGRGNSPPQGSAQEPASGAPAGQPAWGGGGRSARWMDRNRDGKVDLSEVPDFLRGRFESMVRDAGLDASHGISVDRYDELSRQRFAQSGDSRSGDSRSSRDGRREESRDGQPHGAASGQPVAEPRLVPGFGNEFEETPVAGFGEAKDDDNWQRDYEPGTLAQARDIVARYDANKNGVLERSEWKAVQWRSDPNQSDRNKDGKLDLKEMAERLAGQAKEGAGGRGSFGGPVSLSAGGGGPGGSPASGAGSGPGGRKSGGPGGGAESFWRSLDKNNNGRLDRDEIAGNSWAPMGVRQAGFDPEKGVGLQEFLDARARSGGGRFGTGFGQGSRPGGGGFGFGGPMGFGAAMSGFGSGDPGDAVGIDFGEGGGSGESTGDGRRASPRGSRSPSGGSKATGKKTDGASPAGFRFQTSQELLPKDLPAWFLSKDKNADGQVSMNEFSIAWSDGEVARFKQYDLNNDGILTAAEVLAKSGRSTSREDSESTASDAAASDGEGAAAATETKTDPVVETRPASTSSTPAGSSPPVAPGGPSAANVERAKQYMTKYDKNRNGVLEIDEWWTSKLLPAKDADANGDEKITEEELFSYFQKRFPDQ